MTFPFVPPLLVFYFFFYFFLVHKEVTKLGCVRKRQPSPCVRWRETRFGGAATRLPKRESGKLVEAKFRSAPTKVGLFRRPSKWSYARACESWSGFQWSQSVPGALQSASKRRLLTSRLRDFSV
ncbi:hypothetical protein BCV70DRAFT_74326 [Testicularia cyperi]|uniref:Uncharacterized protein n=1 Tax=Testicularia cyperi TaxID=1882483 RepID=A0A317XTP5_9BASI|nr:hypothetical protein BCV70DRAFT_74326 [Testicularia cyperi]